MPLIFPDEYKPDLSDAYVVELLCHDADNKRGVRVYVADQVCEEHAIVAGWKEPLGEYDRRKLVADALAGVVAEASRTYDAQGKPQAVELHRRPGWNT